ncbi:MAG TPA: LapA family protein [Dokdonella sp.]|nr:LapA family protein [Dokdonella sp.]
MPMLGNARKIRLVTILVVIVLVLLVIWQNSEPIRLSLLIFSAVLPLMVWLAVFLVIGLLLGIALMWSYRRRS